ncbi:succinate dehydrogenase, hydrophobic membrane anchor protein [Tsuneonella sp. SYSU-LHT278]|uniref:succinate dehydrogenase, hydrophobic membrane anchor protein n=1 Tax=Tsuneonella sediminis TaxID=3416089 RepID=UPI003F7A2784
MGNGTSIGKVRGLGSAHHGSHHWLLQRFTAIGNVVLGLFLAISLALLPAYDFATVKDWLSQPLPAAALAIWIVNVFWHARLGLQVLVEDYVHTPGNKFAAIAALNGLAVAGAGFGLFSIIRIALGGAA